MKFRIKSNTTGESVAESETREGIESALYHIDGPRNGETFAIYEDDTLLGTQYRDGGINWTWDGRERGWR